MPEAEKKPPENNKGQAQEHEQHKGSSEETPSQEYIWLPTSLGFGGSFDSALAYLWSNDTV